MGCMEEMNIFKQIQYPLKEVPPSLRDKVQADVEDAKLLMEIVELFSRQYGNLAENLFKKVKKI